jgi:two-component system, LytTR family, response regulator
MMTTLDQHELAPIAEDVRHWSRSGQLPGQRGPVKYGTQDMADMSIRLLLIDRDSVERSALRSRLSGRDRFEVIGEASSAEDAVKKTMSLRPDAIFVDVRTMESAGLGVARLLSRPADPIVVFLATHKDYAWQAFDVGAADYLLKPMSDDRFEISLKRIQEQFGRRSSAVSDVVGNTAVYAQPSSYPPAASGRIAITDRKRTHVIETNEIEWIGAAGDYTELHVRGATHLLREPLSVLFGKLPAHVFCRIHRSFVVNLGKVSGFKALRNQDLLVRMKDRTVLRASRTFSHGLKKAIAQECVWQKPISSGH